MIFTSYSHADRVWLERFLRLAKPLKRCGGIVCWSDQDIGTGEKWKEEITESMEKADVAVLLVSDNFLASDFIVDHELPFFLDAAEQNRVKLFWILLAPCLWNKTELKGYQGVIGPNEEPLNALNDYGWQTVLTKVCLDIDNVYLAKETPVINSALDGRSLPQVNPDLKILAKPAARDTEILVFSGDNQWYKQAPVKAGEMTTKIHIGSKGSEKGREYKIIAITTDAPLRKASYRMNLPVYRKKSATITVKRG